MATDDRAITNLNMAINSHLAGERDITADSHAAGDPNLGAKDAVSPNDDIMGNLHQIVDLDALLNRSSAETRPIYR